ncbi:uncharacterized protein LOC109815906 [Cajanus cajan]|uniref:Early nodulin-like protein 1 n=1 Tax=Cajanus cajan TaxID=3821 RepID=A0A151RTS8_CAJCA|nr:uncharacterized protein LOC109815906 [Cajanus cajan]KYP45956.1 hypothetical protein KK1_032451 [Cajanus cajan]
MIMSLPIFFFTLLPLLFLFHSSHCTTILVDGSSEWKNPTVHIGDSIIFKHKQHYNIYIFKNQKAFDLCNFTQATLLTNPNTASYTWHPSRHGFFYFSFNDGSFKACQGTSQKLAIKVTSLVAATPHASAMPPELSAAPFSGQVPSSSPFYPLQAGSPSPSVTDPLAPYKSGSLPFITSNPAVPLPTDEVDSAAIHPLPTSSAHQGQVMIGSFGLLIGVLTITLLLLLDV